MSEQAEVTSAAEDKEALVEEEQLCCYSSLNQVLRYMISKAPSNSVLSPEKVTDFFIFEDKLLGSGTEGRVVEGSVKGTPAAVKLFDDENQVKRILEFIK